MFNYKKAAQLINIIAVQNNGSVSKLKAFKLIWLINRLHLRLYARTVTGEKHVAMEHGPVPSETKDSLESRFKFTPESKYFDEFLSLSSNDIKSKSDPDMLVFSKSDITIINTILEKYGKYSPWQLRERSHLFPEWRRYEKELEKRKTSFPIQTEDYFSLFDDGSGIFNQDQDHLNAIKEEYLENAK